jgi:hypothetical protein
MVLRGDRWAFVRKLCSGIFASGCGCGRPRRILDGEDKHREAERLYKQAIAVFRKALGPENYELAVNYNNLAAL